MPPAVRFVPDLALELATYRHPLDQRVIDAQLDLVLAFRNVTIDRFADAPLQPNLEQVLAVERERVSHGYAPARRERQVLAHPGILPRRDRHPIDLLDRAILERSDREATDLRGGCDVAIHQRRGHREHVGVVVEAEARHVAWEQRLAVDLQRQQVAYDVDILGAIQSVRRHASRVGCCSAHPVELPLERRDERGDRRLLGPRAPLWQHLPIAEFPDDLFEQFAVQIDPADVDRVEHHASRLQPPVVTRHTVLIEQRT